MSRLEIPRHHERLADKSDAHQEAAKAVKLINARKFITEAIKIALKSNEHKRVRAGGSLMQVSHALHHPKGSKESQIAKLNSQKFCSAVIVYKNISEGSTVENEIAQSTEDNPNKSKSERDWSENSSGKIRDQDNYDDATMEENKVPFADVIELLKEANSCNFTNSTRLRQERQHINISSPKRHLELRDQLVAALERKKITIKRSQKTREMPNDDITIEFGVLKWARTDHCFRILISRRAELE
jgi:hypothetical protein